MAQQGTEEQTSSDQPSAEDDASGRHRASDEAAADQQSAASETSESSSEDQSAPSEAPTEKQQSAPGSSTSSTDKQSSDSTEKNSSNSSDAPTEKQRSAPSEAPTEKQQRPAASNGQQRGAADTSWAEPETSQRRHVDVGEIAWRAGNVVATVVRTLAFLFALVLIVNVVLVLVGVNPANGVAQFIGGLANLVILGFRDLFLPADPTIALIVNSLVAAVVWVFVGELLSRVIRFLAARVK